MPVISVIVPVYKVEAYLDRCVTSVLNQTFSDYELILVDDGSPDNCPAMCDAFAEKHDCIHVIHQKNGGLSAARNTGIDWVFANSDSQWITFIDSDDWVHPDYLRQLYAAAQETGSLLSACGHFRTGGEADWQTATSVYQCLTADDYYCGESSSVRVVAWGKLYHRSLLENLRFPVGKLHEDEFTTYLAVYKAGKIGITDDQLYAYFQNASGIMQSAWKPKRLDALEAFEQQISFAQQKNNTRLLTHVIRLYVYNLNEQLHQVTEEKYTRLLRKKLRGALRVSRGNGQFLFERKNMWTYEEAYPCKPLWWGYYGLQKLRK